MKISISGLAIAGALLAATVAPPMMAQRGIYYEPRVYNSPSAQYSRDAYVESRSTAADGDGGGLVDQTVVSGYESGEGGFAGCGLGRYYVRRAYDREASAMRQSTATPQRRRVYDDALRDASRAAP